MKKECSTCRLLKERVDQGDHIIADLKSKIEAHRQRISELEAKTQRQKLPDDREGVTHHFVIHAADRQSQPRDYNGYLTVNLYPGTDRVGEIFLKMSHQGSMVSGFCDSWAISMSLLLQHGVPLEKLIDKYKSMRFEPSGITDTPGIRTAQSPVDYVMRYLERRYVEKKSLSDE